MQPPVPQRPESTTVVKPNVPGAPPMPRPWYASPWVFAAVLLVFLAAVTYVSRQLGTRPSDVPAGASTAAPGAPGAPAR